MEWLVRELSALAELLDVQVTPGRLVGYVKLLADLDRQSLTRAVNRAANECTFFPKPAELRKLAEPTEDEIDVEAEAAWQWTLEFMRRHWHPDIGVYPTAPEVPERLAYAVRLVGGFRSLSQMDVNTEAFVRRDFIAAWRRQPTAEQMSDRIALALPSLKSVPLKQLAEKKAMRSKVEVIDSAARERAIAAQQRKADEAAERLEQGRRRHQQQVEWLRKRGLL